VVVRSSGRVVQHQHRQVLQEKLIYSVFFAMAQIPMALRMGKTTNGRSN